MIPNDSQHLHMLVRDRNGVNGSMERETPVSIEVLLNGTPCRDDLALRDVVTGKMERGYHVNEDGWVAVARCSGKDYRECADEALSVVIGGDIRFGKKLGAL